MSGIMMLDGAVVGSVSDMHITTRSATEYRVGDTVRITSLDRELRNWTMTFTVTQRFTNALALSLRQLAREMTEFKLPANWRWYDRYRTQKLYQYAICANRHEFALRRMNLGFSEHQRRQNKRKAFINSLKTVDT